MFASLHTSVIDLMFTLYGRDVDTVDAVLRIIAD